jgi:hypothetical protein
VTSITLSDIAVSIAAHDSPEFCVSWVKDDARYHVWLDRKTMLVRAGLTGTQKTQTLYKNPPLGTKHKGEGWYQTRRLDARKHDATLELVFAHCIRHDLYAKAVAKAKADEEEHYRVQQARIALDRVQEAGPLLLIAAKAALTFISRQEVAYLWSVECTELRAALTTAIETAEGPQEKQEGTDEAA